MRLLNSSELIGVAGGLIFTCEEALIYDVTSFYYIDITKACTKSQYSAYADGIVDLLYTPGFMEMDIDESDRLVVDMIKNLKL